MLEELFKALLHKLMTGEIRMGDLDLSEIKRFCSFDISGHGKGIV